MGQMIMGFVLPFALTFVAIPLESFIHASRTVLGIAMVGLLRAGDTTLRFLANTAYHLGITLTNIYDLIIFIPLRLEEWRLHHKQAQPHESRRHGKKTVDTGDGNYAAERTTVPFKEGHRI